MSTLAEDALAEGVHLLAGDLKAARATIAELEKRIGGLEHDAESFECAMMVLDDLKVPREDSGGEVYSLVGRIQQALTAERQRREEAESPCGNLSGGARPPLSRMERPPKSTSLVIPPPQRPRMSDVKPTAEWRLVPAEPTEHMVSAGVDVFGTGDVSAIFKQMLFYSPDPKDAESGGDLLDAYAAGYRQCCLDTTEAAEAARSEMKKAVVNFDEVTARWTKAETDLASLTRFVNVVISLRDQQICDLAEEHGLLVRAGGAFCASAFLKELRAALPPSESDNRTKVAG